MFEKIELFTQRFEKNSLIKNQSCLLILSFFSCCLLMNYMEFIGVHNSYFCLGWVLVLVVFFNFRAGWAYIALLLLNFWIFLPVFPRTTNHSNLEFFITIVILALVIKKKWSHKFSLSPDLISYVFRIATVTIYFYCGFHKLNTDFFNPNVSCVNYINEYHYKQLSTNYQAFPYGISAFLQYATLFVEMILPFGLLWHKTRKYTAILLLAFHFYLSFNVFTNFSALAAVLILGCLVDFSKPVLKKEVIIALKAYVGILLITVGIIPFLYFFFPPKILRILYGSMYNVAYVVFFLIYFKHYEERISVFRKKYFLPLAVLLILISCWTMKSYIGLGNLANFTMYSNLMTEKSRSNHLLIDTKKTKIFDFEEDNVLVLDIHDSLKKYNLAGYKIPMTEFRYISNIRSKKYPNTKINCTFVYKNDTIHVDDLGKSEYVRVKWWYRYVSFRKLPPEGPSECMW